MSDSILQVDKIIDKAATTNKELAQYSSSAWSWGSGVPSGTILQVAHGSSNAGQQIGSSDTDFTGLSASMTIADGNKVLILVNITVGNGQDTYGIIEVTNASNTVIYQGSSATGNQINTSISGCPSTASVQDQYLTLNKNFNYLWTPGSGVTSITVKLRGRTVYGSNGMFINRPENTGNQPYVIHATSGITIFEVQA